MKTLLHILIAACFVLIAGDGAADTWYKGTTHDLAWDAVTTYEDGTPISGETVAYDLWIKNVVTGSEVKIGSTPNVAGTYVFPARGQYRFGVQATLGEDKSPVCWSSDAACVSTTGIFGGRWLFPFNPKNFRRATD